MRNLKVLGVLGGAGALLALSATTATATPEKPINAANVQTQKDRDGVGCLVSNVGGGDLSLYKYDPNCKSHIVRKKDKDGNFVSLRYQDKGELQPGQTPPDRTLRNEWTDGICELSEVITPSGAYSSDAVCKL